MLVDLELKAIAAESLKVEDELSLDDSNTKEVLKSYEDSSRDDRGRSS